MNTTHVTAFTLVIIGALNWGLVGLFGYNLVEAVFGGVPWLERLIYVIVGAAAVMLLMSHKKDCRACVTGDDHETQSPPVPPVI